MSFRKKTEHHFKSIKSNQFTSFIISFVLPSLFMTILIFIFFINYTGRLDTQEKINTLNLLSSRITVEMNSAIQMSLSYVYDNDTDNFYDYINRMDIEEDPVAYNQLLQLYTKSVSKNVTLLSKNILGFGFIASNANTNLFFYLPRYRNMELIELNDYMESAWYSCLKENDTDVFFVPGISGNETLSIIRAAKDIDKKKTIGYVTVDVSLDFVSDQLDKLSLGSSSGILLFSPDQELLFSSNDTFHPIADSLEPQLDSVFCNGDSFKLYHHTEDTYGFRLYFLSSSRELYAGFFSAFGFVFLFYAGIMLITCILYLHYAREITSSIRPILETMTKYNGGDPTSQCCFTDCPILEFRIISENLNTMIQKINLHISNEYKLEIEKKNAEFQALQSEVNPHFLYNTLNLFISLNRIGAKTELEKAIVSLSSLFRYTCEHKADSNIEKEFAFISNYLYLQQIRFDDRLTFQIYLEPGLEYFQIPKLLIQPLVENAIIHSLEPSGTAIHIQIFAVTVQTLNNEHFTVISVVNTGLPFIRENVIDNRVGLKNIQERLRIFHPDSFFYISGGEGKPTKCYIMIPLENMEVKRNEDITGR